MISNKTVPKDALAVKEDIEAFQLQELLKCISKLGYEERSLIVPTFGDENHSWRR